LEKNNFLKHNQAKNIFPQNPASQQNNGKPFQFLLFIDVLLGRRTQATLLYGYKNFVENETTGKKF